MSVQRTMSETSASEFWEWMVHLNDVERDTNKWELYAARIHGAVLRIFSTHPERIKDEELLIQYKEPEKVEPVKKKTLEERTKEARSFWGRLFQMRIGKDK